MELDQLMGRHLRLQQDLAIAAKSQPRGLGRLSRLANDIAAAERQISAMQSASRAILSQCNALGNTRGATDSRS